MEEKYYSFFTGFHTEGKSKWKHIDIKIPAYDIVEAITTFYWHQEYHMRLSNQYLKRKKEYKLPDRVYVFGTIRGAIEYRIARKSGYFLVQYKKIRTYNGVEIYNCFK